MTDIILSTLNARYIHTSLGLRYLQANLGALQSQSRIMEFTIQGRSTDIAEQLLAQQPKVIGLGVYIWNIRETTELVAILKQVAPEVYIVLGGPEVSHEQQAQAIVQFADYVISGAAEHSFAQLCQQLLNAQKPLNKLISSSAVALDQLQHPYALYNDEDIRHRLIYVEASRGCPFKCEFCLSSLDKTAKPFDLTAFLEQMRELYRRGVRHFKFIDRTFNLKIEQSLHILDFFLQECPASFLHFELIPDHLPEALKAKIAAFTPGALQFEIGIQSFNPEVQQRISRKQNNEKSIDNLRWLREHTHAHLHTDLIVGLPGETLDSFAQGFDQLVALNPHEIQVGILKRLRGTPIIRHTIEYHMVYNPQPPYNILSNSLIDFGQMQHMVRFARFWDMIGNSGRFQQTLPHLLADQPFERFMQLSHWLYQQLSSTTKIALPRLYHYVYQAAISILDIPEAQASALISADFKQSKLKGEPRLEAPSTANSVEHNKNSTTRRQQRHR